jgi:hypothetical protein
MATKSVGTSDGRRRRRRRRRSRRRRDKEEEISKLSGNYLCEKNEYPTLVPFFSSSVMWRSHQYVVQSVAVHIQDAYCSAEILAHLFSF